MASPCPVCHGALAFLLWVPLHFLLGGGTEGGVAEGGGGEEEYLFIVLKME